MTARFVITKHAVERYIQRFAPDMQVYRAFNALRGATEGARPLKKLTNDGHERFLLPDLEVIAIVRRRGKARVIVTVEPPPPEPEEYALPDAAVEYLERAASRPNPGKIVMWPAPAPPAPPMPTIKPLPPTVARVPPLPPAPPKPPTPAPTSRGEVNAKRLIHAETLKLAQIKEVEKTKRHELAQQADAIRAALRDAIWALLGHNDKDSLALIEARLPWALTPEFLLWRRGE